MYILFHLMEIINFSRKIVDLPSVYCADLPKLPGSTDTINPYFFI